MTSETSGDIDMDPHQAPHFFDPMLGLLSFRLGFKFRTRVGAYWSSRDCWKLLRQIDLFECPEGILILESDRASSQETRL